MFEMVLVVMVLAVVATVAMPRFSDASVVENRTDDLCNHLQLLRSRIELYKVQHRGLPPMRTADGAIEFDSTFAQMRYCTDVDGNIKADAPKTKRDSVYTCGPYLERIPTNPFNGSDAIVEVRSRDDIPVAGSAGWAFVPETGEIYANDSMDHAGL